MLHIGSIISRYAYVVVLGDFNCTVFSTELSEFCYHYKLSNASRLLKTYPSWQPNRALDHILLSPKIEVLSSRVVQSELSDHLPLAVEIRPPGWQS